MPKREYTRESVERAFALHLERGLIRGYAAHGDGTWSVTPNGNKALALRNLREAHVFVYALGSAARSGLAPHLAGGGSA